MISTSISILDLFSAVGGGEKDKKTKVGSVPTVWSSASSGFFT